MNVSQLTETEYLPFYSGYIAKASMLNLINGLEIGLENTALFFESIPIDKLEYQYAKGKWSIKEILQHIIDVERVFAYRALRFSRQDKISLPGFEENDYVSNSLVNTRSIESLILEYKSLRASTISLFKSFNDDMLMQIGIASGGNMSVRAVGFVIIGHEKHHCDIIKERYL